MSTEPEAPTTAEVSAEETKETSTLKVIGWLSVGVAVAAVGIYLGREMFCRYKFNHRNPYEFYAHAGEKQTGEFGLGI